MSVDDPLEAVDHRLVVHEDVYGPFSTCREVDNGEGLRKLCVLRDAVNARTVVHAVVDAVVDAVARSCKQRDGLVGACTVRGSVDPCPTSVVVKVSGVGVLG